MTVYLKPPPLKKFGEIWQWNFLSMSWDRFFLKNVLARISHFKTLKAAVPLVRKTFALTTPWRSDAQLLCSLSRLRAMSTTQLTLWLLRRYSKSSDFWYSEPRLLEFYIDALPFDPPTLHDSLHLPPSPSKTKVPTRLSGAQGESQGAIQTTIISAAKIIFVD